MFPYSLKSDTQSFLVESKGFSVCSLLLHEVKESEINARTAIIIVFFIFGNYSGTPSFGRPSASKL